MSSERFKIGPIRAVMGVMPDLAEPEPPVRVTLLAPVAAPRSAGAEGSRRAMRTASIEHEGKTWRADVDAVDNVRVYAAGELLFVGFMSAGTIRFWEMPDGYNDDAVTALEEALAEKKGAAKE